MCENFLFQDLNYICAHMEAGIKSDFFLEKEKREVFIQSLILFTFTIIPGN